MVELNYIIDYIQNAEVQNIPILSLCINSLILFGSTYDQHPMPALNCNTSPDQLIQQCGMQYNPIYAVTGESLQSPAVSSLIITVERGNVMEIAAAVYSLEKLRHAIQLLLLKVHTNILFLYLAL